MKCSYHPNQEAMAFCVTCGKPVCSECSILLQDNKMHCKQCLVNGDVQIYGTSSWAWWLLPTLLGIVGGLIAFFANSNKTHRLKYIRRSDYLIVGLISTLVVIIWYAIGYDAGY